MTALAARLRIDRVGLAFVAIGLAVYALSNPLRSNLYNHFVWQADAFLHGRFAIAWPVFSGLHVNGYFQDVMPVASMSGFGLIPYPPLPAVLMLPLVTVFGLDTDAAILAAVIGALNVGLAWRLCRSLARTRAQAALATVFFAFGTVAWYAAMLGSTWFLAHTVASTFLLLAIGTAIKGDSALAARPVLSGQFVAGLLFALSALARLTTILGAPFFAFVGAGDARRRAVAAAAGAALPVALLLVYNVASSGSLFHPAYDYAYRTEYTPLPELRHADWAAEDPRYLLQNLPIMLAWLPIVRPECGLSLFDPTCPLIQPDPIGMSLLLTSPGYLLAAGITLGRREPSVARSLERRVVAGSAIAIALIAAVDLAHFSQGWVQFGYRFSNDFAPFALVLVALGITRIGVNALSIALVALSVAINAWGVYWGVTLRW